MFRRGGQRVRRRIDNRQQIRRAEGILSHDSNTRPQCCVREYNEWDLVGDAAINAAATQIFSLKHILTEVPHQFV